MKHWQHSLVALVFVGGMAACGGNSEEAVSPAAVMDEPDTDPRAPRGTLWRDDVVATIDAGFPRFLQGVEVEPRIDRGAFKGFRIVDLRPAEAWSDVDLRPGDVVLTINGRSPERETDAFEIFGSLRTAKEIRVSYERAGQARELVIEIRDRAGAPPPSAAPVTSAPPRPAPAPSGSAG